MAKTSCKKGQYYCNTDQKCKPIPDGYSVRPDGILVKEDKHGDHEPEMIRSQLKTASRASKRIEKHSRKKENFKAWVQSKITKASDYLDTAADYLDGKDDVKEGSLRKWFKGSKSKDGKPGWVQSDGSPCANEPGETKTPKCYSSAKRASMSKKELASADARKSRQDPNQQSKTGAAKPTYVSTDKKPKKKKKTMKDETEFTSLPLVLEVPQNDGEFKLGLMFRESLEQDRGMLFIFESNDYWTFHMKNTFIPLDIAFIKEDGTIDSIEELDPMNPIPIGPESEIRYAVEVNRGWFAENGVVVGDRLLEEEDLTEGKDKKGKGSGSKDACYHKVKSRYSVWPSAYASGALVKCRKVGAANWGNKSESVEVSELASPLPSPDKDTRQKPNPNQKPSSPYEPGKSPYKLASAKSFKKEHYNWRDSFDLEEMTIAQRNSMQNQNKLAARSRAQEMAKQRIAAKNNPPASPKQATPAPKGIAKVDPKQFDSRRAAPASATRKIDGAGLAAKMGAQAVPSAQRPQTSVRTRGGGVQTAPRPSGLVSRIKSRVGAIKQGVGDIARGASSLGKRVAGGVADAATGNKFDFDKRGGQKSAPKIAGSGNVGGSGARAQDALNRNPNPPQKQDALNRSKEKPGATPATNTGGMRPTNTGNARRDNFNAKVNTLKNKQKYGGTGNPITIGDKTYNPQDKGYKDAFNTVSSAVTKSQKNIGVDTSPGKSDSTSLVNNNKKKNIKNANKVTNQMNNLSKKEAEFTGEPAGKTTVGKIDFGGF